MGEKVKNFIKSINIPMIAFIGLSTRIIYVGSGWGEALAIAAIAGLYGYDKFLNRTDIIWMKKVEKEIVDVKNAVSSVKMRQNARSMYEQTEVEKQKPKRYF